MASAATAQFFVTGYVLQGYTATGTYVHPGTCAVDPSVIPLGSYITISGLGTCHAEDTGGAIVGYRIDVWVPTVAQANALTGWYSAAWGARPTQQALASHASQPQSPAPARRLVPHGQARLGHAHHQPGYSHGNAYVHRETRTHAGLIVAPSTDALLSFSLSLSLPVTGCPAGRWTTMVARVQVCRVATLLVLQVSQEGVGLHEGASGIRVDGPLARTQDHEANVDSAKQAHLDQQRFVSSTMHERGVPRGANRGTAVKSVRSVATTGAAIPPVWSLAITMLAVVAAWLRRHR